MVQTSGLLSRDGLKPSVGSNPTSSATYKFCPKAKFYVAVACKFCKNLLRDALMVATFLSALSTGTFMSIGRYILVLFPIYILMALVKNQYQKLTYIFLSTLLLAMNIILFVNNYRAG